MIEELEQGREGEKRWKSDKEKEMKRKGKMNREVKVKKGKVMKEKKTKRGQKGRGEKTKSILDILEKIYEQKALKGIQNYKKI